jgi:2,3-bisphosphoglycerate-dependent phosphoglycerate mutase
MKNSYIFFRHALTRIDKETPAEQWVISDEGIENVCEVISTGKFDDVDVIISSSEKKAIQTAYYLAERIEKEIILNPNFRELERKGEFVETKEDYDTRVWRIFNNPSECSFGWETAERALTRFKQGISRLENTYSGKNIFIVSHGIILSLFVADYYNWDSKKTFEYWKDLAFCKDITLL